MKSHQTDRYSSSPTGEAETQTDGSMALPSPAGGDLEQREKALRHFVEHAAVALNWVAEDGTILWANQAELQLLGYPRDEYIGGNIAEFHVGDTVISDPRR